MMAVMILMEMGRMVMMKGAALARDRAHQILRVDFLAGVMVPVTAATRVAMTVAMMATAVVDRLPHQSLQLRLPVHPTLR